MDPDKRWKREWGEARDESVKKVFIVVGENARKCLICEQLFTREGSLDHSKITCHPHSRWKPKPDRITMRGSFWLGSGRRARIVSKGSLSRNVLFILCR
jgi:hypothetical protein